MGMKQKHGKLTIRKKTRTWTKCFFNFFNVAPKNRKTFDFQKSKYRFLRQFFFIDPLFSKKIKALGVKFWSGAVFGERTLHQTQCSFAERWGTNSQKNLFEGGGGWNKQLQFFWGYVNWKKILWKLRKIWNKTFFRIRDVFGDRNVRESLRSPNDGNRIWFSCVGGGNFDFGERDVC